MFRNVSLRNNSFAAPLDPAEEPNKSNRSFKEAPLSPHDESMILKKVASLSRKQRESFSETILTTPVQRSSSKRLVVDITSSRRRASVYDTSPSASLRSLSGPGVRKSFPSIRDLPSLDCLDDSSDS